jgi:tRNA pseudouridine38-40 synthase
MVRAIVGTLLDVGRGKITVDDFVQIIERKECGAAGASAPARGLFLEQIRYEYINGIV